MKLPIHTIADAPDPAKPLLEAAKKKYNFVPNILAVMANEPPLLEAYMSLSSLFERSSLTPIERQLVLLTVSQANGCQYCMAAHSAMAMMAKVPEPHIAAVRNAGPTGDAKLDALLNYTREMTNLRGNPSAAVSDRLAAAGYSTSQILAVVLAVGMKLSLIHI